MCYHFVTSPDYAMYKDQLALVCPHCFTSLDGRLGYDFVSNEDAHCWNGDDVVQAVWERIVQYERLFLRAVKSRAGHTKSLHVLLEFSALVDLLLRTQIPDRHRSIDLFASPYLPSPTRLGLATRHLDHPFHICQLVERRKALAIIICMFEDANEMFRLDPCFPPMQLIREHLDKPTYNQFVRHILNITRYALPN